jgi:hypothetical protein
MGGRQGSRGNGNSRAEPAGSLDQGSAPAQPPPPQHLPPPDVAAVQEQLGKASLGE